MIEGIKYGAVALLSSGAASYVAHKKNDWYRKRMAISGKVGMPLMWGIFVGCVVWDKASIDMIRTPTKWGFTDPNDPNKEQGAALVVTQPKVIQHSMPIHHKYLFMYFKFILHEFTSFLD